MKRLLLGALVLPGALLASTDDQPGAPLIAADRAFAKAAQSTGEWTATRAFSAPRAEMFVPQRVQTSVFGQDRPDPAVATRWAPEQVWIACDGSAGVTMGRWSLSGTREHGWYEAVWAQLRDGSYKLLLRHGGPAQRQLLSRPGRKGARATCTGQPGLPITAPDVGTDFKFGASHDQTLIWSSAVSPKGDVRVVVSLWDGTRHVPVLIDPAPPLNAR